MGILGILSYDNSLNRETIWLWKSKLIGDLLKIDLQHQQESLERLKYAAKEISRLIEV